jgi:hypothetical protein
MRDARKAGLGFLAISVILLALPSGVQAAGAKQPVVYPANEWEERTP